MKEYTVSGRQANLFGLSLVIPVLLLAGVPYLFIWREPGTGLWNSLHSIIIQNKTVIQQAIDAGWWLILFLLVGIVLHELIHGTCMAVFAKNGWKSVSFGFNIKAFAPYAHCREPLKPAAYRISLLMPVILLGDIPVLVSWFSGNILLLFFGILFSWAAAGDLIVFWLSCNIDDGMIQDHPQKIGFIHIENE